VSNDEMDRAYRADSAAKESMDGMRRQIRQMVKENPRLNPTTRALLLDAADRLQADSDHIVAVWD
jgi:hypothetical protein